MTKALHLSVSVLLLIHASARNSYATIVLAVVRNNRITLLADSKRNVGYNGIDEWQTGICKIITVDRPTFVFVAAKKTFGQTSHWSAHDDAREASAKAGPNPDNIVGEYVKTAQLRAKLEAPNVRFPMRHTPVLFQEAMFLFPTKGDIKFYRVVVEMVSDDAGVDSPRATVTPYFASMYASGASIELVGLGYWDLADQLWSKDSYEYFTRKSALERKADASGDAQTLELLADYSIHHHGRGVAIGRPYSVVKITPEGFDWLKNPLACPTK